MLNEDFAKNRLISRMAEMGNSAKQAFLELWCKFQYEFSILFILGFEFVVNVPVPKKMLSFNNTHFTFSYQYGFSSRMLIGSLFNLIARVTGQVQTPRRLWNFLFVSTAVLCILYAFYAGSVIRKTHGGTKYFAMYVTAFFLASPASISFLFRYLNYGRLELFNLIFTFITLFIAEKPIFKWAIPILCFISIATHQVVGLFFQIPVIMIALLYAIYKNRINRRKNHIVLAAVSVLVSGVSFIYFQIFSKKNLKFTCIEDFIDEITSRSSLKIRPDYIMEEYFAPFGHYLENMLPSYKYHFYAFFVAIILFLPLLVFIILFWYKCINETSNNFFKFILGLSVVLPLASIPAYVLGWDWWRWVALNIINEFILIYFFIKQGEASVLKVCEEYAELIGKYKFFFLLGFIYMCYLGKLDNLHYFTDTIETVIRYIARITGWNILQI